MRKTRLTLAIAVGGKTAVGRGSAMATPRSRQFSPVEFPREAVGLVRGGRTVRDVAESLGVSQQTLRNWVKRTALDRHDRDDGLTSAERDELRRLRRENARLKQEREIL